MDIARQLRNDSYLKTIDERGKKRKKFNSYSEPKEIIDVCLNCTYDKCRGYCDKIKELKNGKK